MRYLLIPLLFVGSTRAAAQTALPPLPDTTGWGVHVLTVERDADGGVWVGTYGRGIYHLAPGAAEWCTITSDTTAQSLSWDFVQAIAFGPDGQVWYGTVGNGWGLSTDGGRTWRNWTFDQLGPEWQYVAPGGIATYADTTMVATADGVLFTTDDGGHWTALIDSTGPPAKGPADAAIVLLGNEYVRRLGRDPLGWVVETLRGVQRLRHTAAGWRSDSLPQADSPPVAALTLDGRTLVGSHCGLRAVADTAPCLANNREVRDSRTSDHPLTTWFQRPIAPDDNNRIDQTYRYGSTMGGNFQQHQGVEFNNPDGTPVHAIGAGEVVHAGRAEQGALTVAIRHDSSIVRAEGRDTLWIYSVYYHNSALDVEVGDRVRRGEVIARVGHTGRATNDHLHLEVHAAPTRTVEAIVDPEQRFPPYTTNPELWIEPLPGTGIVAGQVRDSTGAPVPNARIYGLHKAMPLETPFSFVETYGDRAHSHPLYREDFAIGSVPPGTYVLGTEIAGRRAYRRVRVEPGRVSWVVFR